MILFDDRPFLTVSEMDEAIIQNWNRKVKPEDDVWILGDFVFRSRNSPEWYLQKLQGHKHLIVGNHDSATLKSRHLDQYIE